jgi:hypothetical protein
VYWTLKTPLANIIGMASNVPKFGVVTEEQIEWLKYELKAANAERPDKALIITIHHAPYTADINHGSSIPMFTMLESVFEETGIRPDIVFSGHVHNYQHLIRRYETGNPVHFIVAGGGGYDELHPIAELEDDRFTNDYPTFKDIELLNYCTDKHGFLKVTLERTKKGITLTGNYYAMPNATLKDTFVLEIPT